MTFGIAKTSTRQDAKAKRRGPSSRPCFDVCGSRGFTLVELIIAVTITAFVLGVLWTTVGNMSRARNISRARMLAHLRADTALNTIRRDVASVLRSDDLYWTMLRIENGGGVRNGLSVDRDDLLLFSSRFVPTRPLMAQGEGLEYETQYRIMDDAVGSVLWQRRDPAPDEFYDGGGIATPIVEGVAGLNVEAWDGVEWWTTWNSDDYGLPLAVRISVVVPIEGKPGERPVVLSTLVSIERVPPPYDAEPEDEEEEPEGGVGEGETDDEGEGDPGGVGGAAVGGDDR